MDGFTGRLEHCGFYSLAGLSERIGECCTAPWQTTYIVLHVQKLRTYLQIRTTKAKRFAVETHHLRIHSTSVRAARTHNQTTGCYDQAPAMNWDLEVSWGRGV